MSATTPRIAERDASRVVPLASLSALAALAAALPTGAVTGRRRRATRRFLVAIALAGAPFVIAIALSENTQLGPVVAETVTLGVIALAAFVVRCRDASAIDRARLQW